MYACKTDSRSCTAATAPVCTTTSTTSTTDVSRGISVPGGGGADNSYSAALLCRRSFVIASAGALLLGEGAFQKAAAAAAAAPSQAVIRAAEHDIEVLIAEDPNFGPTLVRLAWHSSGTYDRMSKTGGSSKGTIRFEEELGHGANAGLDVAVDRLRPVAAKNPGISFADLCTLSGVVAVRALGGPTVGWRGGRVDSMELKDVPPDGRLPEADRGGPKATAAHLREVFGRMGFSDRELVALSGAHTIGYCRPETSGYTGKWTPSPTRFNNIYYRILLNMR